MGALSGVVLESLRWVDICLEFSSLRRSASMPLVTSAIFLVWLFCPFDITRLEEYQYDCDCFVLFKLALIILKTPTLLKMPHFFNLL